MRLLAEGRWRGIKAPGLGDLGGIEGVDRAADTVTARVQPAAKVGRVRERVNGRLRASGLADRVTILLP